VRTAVIQAFVMSGIAFAVAMLVATPVTMPYKTGEHLPGG
jgi:hypothetical protein